jgi:histone-lysine N-methyltransferase SETD3
MIAYRLRILTNSRSFTVNLNNEYVPVLVPLADFVNHDPNGFLEFDYSPKHDGFFM